MKSQDKKERVGRQAVVNKKAQSAKVYRIVRSQSGKMAASDNKGASTAIDTKNYASAINYLVNYEKEEMNALIYASSSKA